MAELTRRGWSEILTEVKRRSGGKNYSGWPARAQQFISAAYLDICNLYRHVELEATLGSIVSPGVNYFSLATFDPSVYFIHVLYESVNDSGTTPSLILTRKDSAAWAMSYLTTNGQPESFSVRGDTGDLVVVFNRKTDIERSYILIYQTVPDRPDFSTSDTPVTGQQWDEHLIELSLVKIGVAIGDQNLASVNAALFKDFVSQAAQSLVQDAVGTSKPESTTSNKMPSGRVP